MTKKITKPCGGADKCRPSKHTRSKSNGITMNPTPKDSIHFSDDQKDEIRKIITEEIAKAMPSIIAAVRNADDKISDNENSNMNNNQLKKKKCHYKDFLACEPETFNGENGPIEAYDWLEKMESVLEVSDCDEKDKVRFAAHSFKSVALFWWAHVVQTRGRDVVYEISWNEFKELVIEKFCPYSELMKIEHDLRNLKMNGLLDFTNYTLKFNKLSRLVPNMVTPESEKIWLYIEGLAPEVKQYVLIGNHKTFQSAVDMAGKLTGNMLSRRNEDISLKRERDEDNNSGCEICGKMHAGRCWFEGKACGKCKKIGHTTDNCWAKEVTCYDCGESGHYNYDCSNRKH